MVMFSAQDIPSRRPWPLRSSVIRQRPLRTASRGVWIPTRSPSTVISPAILRVRAENRPRRLRPAAPHQARDADDLALANREGDLGA